MAGELAAQSSSRSGASVLWIVIHTAEGPTDEFPSRPDLDAGSARDLLAFFEGKTDRSCHAIADDDVLLDNLVDYSRAAWTLRGGNPYSDNLEMCGLASWSRAEWLAHTPMLANAARWVAARLHARKMSPRRVSAAEVAAKSARGYMDHNTYTVATKDGTHWDCGPNFPWDVFGAMVTAVYNGQPVPETIGASFVTYTPDEERRILKAADQILATIGAGQTSFEGTVEAILSTVQTLVNLANADAAQGRALAAGLTDARSAVLAAVAALPTDHLDEQERQALAEAVAAKVSTSVPEITVDELLDAAGQRLYTPAPAA